MASFVPNNADTLEDQRLYTQARQTEVACLDCLARVGVKKNSDHHTSIQWNRGAVQSCLVLARRELPPTSTGGRAAHVGCPRLSASIEAAVAEGMIPIGAEDGY